MFKKGQMNNLKFQYPWRNYQERILNELQSHLDDKHLHIVAAPGSGKTILGLEVMRQLNQPTLILAPTITIRNQWIDRLSMFAPPNTPKPNWVSKNLREPKFLTVITYQALHAAFSGEKEINDIGNTSEEETTEIKQSKEKPIKVIELLKQQNVQTLILDEAHHLRKEWWKALTKLKSALNDVHTISLTATPPYDVEYTEWLKYQELCGPVDAEISIPELVLQGDLCPHQDYVHFSIPHGTEAKKFHQFKTDIWAFLEEIKQDDEFLNLFSIHPWVADTENYIDDILSEPAIFSSIIIFLNAANIPPPEYALEILGVKRADIPKLNTKWIETFFTAVLYTHIDYFKDYKDITERVRAKLKKIGAIERKRIVIDNTKSIKKLLASSLGKLDSILDITKTESQNLDSDLRMVILADYIRSEEMPSIAGGEKSINKIGIVPIFEYLRRTSIPNIKLGVLTGSLIIIPREAQNSLINVAQKNNVSEKHIKFKKLIHDPNFLKVHIIGESRQKMVYLITEIFNLGEITTLIGTQALLGEGWDAPSVNTLILASYVGSYMLSNQMRGRAIRIDPNRPNKVSNIWHLVALDIETIDEKIRSMATGESQRQQVFDPFSDIKQDLGHDIKTLYRRFKAFEGLSFYYPPTIENGFKRLALCDVKWTKKGVENVNKKMLDCAGNRDALPKLWSEALIGQALKPKMREKLETNNSPKGLVFADTLKYLIMNALITGASWGLQILEIRTNSGESFVFILFAALFVAFCFAAPKLLKALWLWLRNGSIAGNIKQVGYCVVETLYSMGIVKTNKKNIDLKVFKNKIGIVYCRLDGATNIEKRYFMEAMEDILNPIENPRYLIQRKSHFGIFIHVDYHTVPKIIGQKKEHAEFFIKRWKHHIGNSTLIYTRCREGRMALLKARTKSFSSAFRKKTDRVSSWE